MTAEEFYYNWVVEGNNIDKGIIEVAEAYHKYKLNKLPPSEEVKALIGRLKSALEEIDYLYEQQADFGY